MAEEFDESEVVFSDNNSNNFDDNSFCNNSSSNMKERKNKKKKKRSISASVPVNIPSNGFDQLADSGEFEEEYGGGEGIIPPHVLIGRRIQGKMAFSVCTGNGRTLKGRDLSQVRNSILRLTGFLEA